MSKLDFSQNRRQPKYFVKNRTFTMKYGLHIPCQTQQRNEN